MYCYNNRCFGPLFEEPGKDWLGLGELLGKHNRSSKHCLQHFFQPYQTNRLGLLSSGLDGLQDKRNSSSLRFQSLSDLWGKSPVPSLRSLEDKPPAVARRLAGCQLRSLCL